ncbi:MAG TPA: NYN domain-containing protein [Clostridia bacterium]|nr:NYN domain-containing protein [Clostridia bacterium]
MQKEKDLNLAVLIDSDNVSHRYVKAMMDEIARYGTPTIKRIYGDWTTSTGAGWKAVLLNNAITPIQQYSYTVGKNSTDSAMIIDAMDILYGEKVDGFCIVSSDSDFTRLATRLREAGLKVFGIGEKKTPEPFIAACDKFIYLEILTAQNGKKDAPAKSDSGTRSTTQKVHASKITEEVANLIVNSVNDIADDEGWAFLGDVGNMLIKKQPAFDSRNYGYTKLTPLIKSTDLFDIDQRDTSNRGIKHIFIRDKAFVQSDK